MSLKLTVIGSATPYPVPNNPCSCYLLQYENENLLLDCGAGGLVHLTEIISPDDLTGVILSHWHGDHCSDLLVLKYAAVKGLERGTRSHPLPVYCPFEPAAMVDLIRGKDAIVPVPFEPGTTRDIGGLTCSAWPTVHALPGIAVRIDSPHGSLLYTGDTGPSTEVSRGAAGVNLLLCEATYSSSLTASVPGHLSDLEAGELAAGSGCDTLVVTHVDAVTDVDRVLAGIRSKYGGSMLYARPGLAIDLVNHRVFHN